MCIGVLDLFGLDKDESSLELAMLFQLRLGTPSENKNEDRPPDEFGGMETKRPHDH